MPRKGFGRDILRKSLQENIFSKNSRENTGEKTGDTGGFLSWNIPSEVSTEGSNFVDTCLALPGAATRAACCREGTTYILSTSPGMRL